LVGRAWRKLTGSELGPTYHASTNGNADGPSGRANIGAIQHL
jgi:hypothetical protein